MNVSTSTSALSAATTTGAVSGHRGHGPSEKTMEAVAQKLGMSTDDLKSSLASGQSMTDLASKAGVSKDDLVATIAGTLPTTGRDGQAIDTTQMATRIADRTRPSGPPPGAPSSSSSSSSSSSTDLGQGLDALSSALGVSSDDLLKRLTDGTGIGDLLSGNSDLAAQLSSSQNKGALVDGWA